MYDAMNSNLQTYVELAYVDVQTTLFSINILILVQPYLIRTGKISVVVFNPIPFCFQFYFHVHTERDGHHSYDNCETLQSCLLQLRHAGFMICICSISPNLLMVMLSCDLRLVDCARP